MATLLYTTRLPYWLLGVVLLKLAVAQVVRLGQQLGTSIDVPSKLVVTAEQQYSKSEPPLDGQHETDTEALALVVAHLGSYLGPRLELAPAPASFDRVQPQWYGVEYHELV